MMSSPPSSERLPLILFVFGLMFLAFVYGMLVTEKKWFPYYQILDAGNALALLVPENKSLLWFFSPTTRDEKVTVVRENAMAPGLTKLVTVDGDFSLAVRVIDAQGNAFQRWRIEWKAIWPDANHLNANEIPKARPGTHIHGAEILQNGDLVFNFEHLGLVRLDACGNVVWRLPVRTHHSVFIDDDGNLWVSAQFNHLATNPNMPLYKPPYIEPVVLQVSPDGKILQQKSVIQLLLDNQQEGALYAATMQNDYPIIEGDAIFPGDALHLNDVEVFSRAMAPGIFQPGDIMISLRNINSVMVFDQHWKLKYTTEHSFIRQHDPDFVDGNRISIFDNHNTGTLQDGAQSRILVTSADTGAIDIPFAGTKEAPFYTNIMGKHQWLPNGNLLLAESRYGRALEISPSGEKVWEYYNLVEPGWLGIIEEVERLPTQIDANFFSAARARCEANPPTAITLQGASS